MASEKKTSEAVAQRDASAALVESILAGTQATPAMMEELDSVSANIAKLSSEKLTGFVGMMALAKTASDMKQALCRPELRQLVMGMAGNPLFFRTDAQYPQETVAQCIVQGYSLGLPPVGNLWNIIGGRFYVTREGVEFKLSSMGVSWSVTPGEFKEGIVIHGYVDKAGRQHAETVYKAVPVTVDYLYRGEKGVFESVKQVKAANGWTVENCVGKATRKALYDLWRILGSREGMAVPGIQDEEPEDAQAVRKAEVVIEAEPAKKTAQERKKGVPEHLQDLLDDAGVNGIDGQSFAEYILKTRGALPSEEKHYAAIAEKLADYVDGYKRYCSKRAQQGKEEM